MKQSSWTLMEKWVNFGAETAKEEIGLESWVRVMWLGFVQIFCCPSIRSYLEWNACRPCPAPCRILFSVTHLHIKCKNFAWIMPLCGVIKPNIRQWRHFSVKKERIYNQVGIMYHLWLKRVAKKRLTGKKLSITTTSSAHLQAARTKHSSSTCAYRMRRHCVSDGFRYRTTPLTCNYLVF